MRAHHIMTRNVITVSPRTSIVQAAEVMLQNHISGLPVVSSGKLVGIISESDFLRRCEIGTGRKRSPLLQFFFGPGRAAADYVHERGLRVEDVMTKAPITVGENVRLDDLVKLMERKGIKRFPVVRDGVLLGIVTRSNLLQAVASIARDIPDPTANDDQIRDRLVKKVQTTAWAPIDFRVTVLNGVVHLHGLIITPEARQAAIVAAENTSGVKEVHDHLCLVDTLFRLLRRVSRRQRRAAIQKCRRDLGEVMSPFVTNGPPSCS